jgi:hypothetical protein
VKVDALEAVLVPALALVAENVGARVVIAALVVLIVAAVVVKVALVVVLGPVVLVALMLVFRHALQPAVVHARVIVISLVMIVVIKHALVNVKDIAQKIAKPTVKHSKYLVKMYPQFLTLLERAHLIGVIQ